MAIAQRYNVGGVLLPRPFKVRRLGHFGFNACKVPGRFEVFYQALLGFKISDTLDFAQFPGCQKPQKRLAMRGAFLCAMAPTTTPLYCLTSG